jgi:TusE/DsrC/DsvC family sulfur relay protein
MGIEVNGVEYETDEEGYLINLAEWNEDIANVIAKGENVDMTPSHWEVVNFLRDYYNEYQIAPAVRVLTKAIGKQLGEEKGNSKYLYELFPYGPPSRPARSRACPSPRAASSPPAPGLTTPRRAMSALAIGYALLFYAATLVLVVGVAAKVRSYVRTPAPLLIPTTPAPTTRGGVVLRMTREVVLFESLFKASKWTWAFGWLFHASLLLVLVRHMRYFQEPVWAPVALAQFAGTYAGFTMAAGLAGLWARRVLVDRVRYISTPSDHLHLALLLAIGLSGLTMRFVAHTDIVAVKQLLHAGADAPGDPSAAADDPLLLIHLGLVALLMLVFPISKLLHAPGLFFSPTRNQVDNPRDSRHQAKPGRQRWTPEVVHGRPQVRDPRAQAVSGDSTGGRGIDGPQQALRGQRGDPDQHRVPRRADRWLGAARRRQDGRAAGQVPFAAGLHGRLRALRRLQRQVPLLPRHRRPQEHAGGAPGPDARRVPPLLHLRRQALPQAGGRHGHDPRGAGRVVELLQPVQRMPSLLSVLPLRHRHRRSHHGRARDHGLRRPGPEVRQRDHRQGASRSATTWACPARRWKTPCSGWKRTPRKRPAWTCATRST